MLDGRRVLAVDSNEDIATLYEVVLRANRADFRVATGGADALACIEPAWVPHVLVVHRWLKDMTAAELAAAVNVRAGMRVGVVCTTGDARTSALDAVRSEGFDELLVKPIELDALLASIARVARSAAGAGPA